MGHFQSQFLQLLEWQGPFYDSHLGVKHTQVLVLVLLLPGSLAIYLFIYSSREAGML